MRYFNFILVFFTFACVQYWKYQDKNAPGYQRKWEEGIKNETQEMNSENHEKKNDKKSNKTPETPSPPCHP